MPRTYHFLSSSPEPGSSSPDWLVPRHWPDYNCQWVGMLPNRQTNNHGTQVPGCFCYIFSPVEKLKCQWEFPSEVFQTLILSSDTMYLSGAINLFFSLFLLAIFFFSYVCLHIEPCIGSSRDMWLLVQLWYLHSTIGLCVQRIQLSPQASLSERAVFLANSLLNTQICVYQHVR